MAENAEPLSVDQTPSGKDEERIASVQKTLGLLFTPVSVIALLCSVLGISAQNTASISLASIILTAIILYRNWINRTAHLRFCAGYLWDLVQFLR